MGDKMMNFLKILSLFCLLLYFHTDRQTDRQMNRRTWIDLACHPDQDYVHILYGDRVSFIL